MEQMHIAHSEALYDRAKELMPGGVNSPVRAFQSVGGTPRFIQRAKDQYLYDEDGNVYIDYIGSWGPMILGHNPDIVLEAVRNQLENGLSYGTGSGNGRTDSSDRSLRRNDAYGKLRHRGSDECCPCRKRIYRTGQDRQV